MSSEITRLLRSPSGTSPSTMRRARPSTIAVLPTPGSPMSTGLFFVRRDSTWMMRRISSSRPMTGSILPGARGLGEIAAVLLERLVLLLGVVARDAVRAAHLAQRVEHRVVVMPNARSRSPTPPGTSVIASSRCSVDRYSSSSCARSLVGGLEHAERRSAPSCASRTVAPLTCGSFAERFVDPAAHRADVDADALEHAGHDAFGLIEQRAQQVLGRDLGVAGVAAERLRGARTPLGSCG